MSVRTYTRAFNGGEIAQSMYSRIDDGKYQTGLAKCKNFFVEPQGPIAKRPGFAYVNSAGDESRKVRLIPFTFNSTQSLVMEFGHRYIRFHTQGLTVMSSSSPYQVSTPYSESELFDIHYVQSNDVVTLVHPNHPPKELRRYGATSWSLVTIGFGPTLSPPPAPNVSQSINSNVENPSDYTRTYAITSLDADGKNESKIGASTTINCNPYGEGAYNTISWGGVAGAGLYRVYRKEGGIWGYIGQTTGTSLIDENLKIDASITPPLYDLSLESASDFPGAVSYFEQRRFFAGTWGKPANIWATKSGTESDMSYSLPAKDDDRIAMRVAARDANRILHIVPLSRLMLLTASTEWGVTSLNSDALTSASLSVRPQSYVGASEVQPLVINNQMLYGAARGGHIQECGYSYEAGGYITHDVCLRAPHLFDNLQVTDLAYAKAPYPVVYAVSSSGKMIAFTYVPEQSVGAFSTVETDGAFESCCVVQEGDEDILYAVVRRTINGKERRFIERMHERQFTTLAESVFLDCCGTYRGEATTEINGLSWLEGKEVAILADGGVEPRQVVKDGRVTLSYPAKVVRVGLPYESDAKTLPIALQLQDGSFGSGHQKNVRKVWFRVVDSGGMKAGPSFEKLVEYPARKMECPGSPPDPLNDEFGFPISAKWSPSGQVCVRQDNPLPLRIVSMTMDVELF